ncbi:MAG: hypothetical protein NT023_07225 [Armatimonadetes bacterium]|nr:hypothetical protein [Armatimonadota bacterium]
MLFPKSRLRFTKTYQGKVDSEGWLVLELSAQDLEGVNKVYIPFSDIASIQKQGDTALNRLNQARTLLGAGGDTLEEEEGG